MSLRTDDVIDGKYRIVRLLGEGGMGAVYEGENTRIHRRVAIKVLHAAFAAEAEAVQRFEREAQAAGRIGSEHIVEVLDLGNLPNGERYMVMEFLEGESLSQRVRARGRLGPGELHPIVVQMLDALAAAHAAGIIHRDLKPDNVFLMKSRGGRTDFVKLLDFGISKFSQLNNDSGFSMTRTGSVMGTPYYLAPEQAKGSKRLDHRVDLYAAGVILYEAVAGRVPFNADSFNELLFKIALETPTSLEQIVPGLDPYFAAIVNKAMSRDPDLRFQSAQEFRHALDEWARAASPQALVGPALLSDTGRRASSAGEHTAAAQTGPTPITAGARTPTPGAWSQTEPYPGQTAPAAKKSRGPLIAVLGTAAALLIGVGAVGVKLSRDASAARAEEEAAQLRAESERAAAARLAELEREREEAERAKAEAEKARLEAEQARAEAAKAAEQASAQKSVAARAEAERLAEQRTKEAAAAEARARDAKARAAKAAAAASAKKPDPKPAASTPAAAPTGGRRIRTEL